jgi:cytochrome c oxidase assembly factor CtaG
MFEGNAHGQPWPLTLAFTSAIVATGIVYLRGWIRLREDSPRLASAWHLVAFISGLASVWIAVASPLATLDHRSLTLHMVKHLLLMTVAAPLLLAGSPALPLRQALSHFGLPHFVQSNNALGNRATRWLKSAFAHPWFCWLAGTIAVIGWHLPAAFQLGMRSHWIHSLEDASFLLAGLLFWWPVIQPSSSTVKSPRWSMALYLFLATLPCDVLSAFLVFSNRIVYHRYMSATSLFSLSPLQDQEFAGALMWVWVTFAYLIPAVVITLLILSPSNAYSPSASQTSSALWTRPLPRSNPAVSKP